MSEDATMGSGQRKANGKARLKDEIIARLMGGIESDQTGYLEGFHRYINNGFPWVRFQIFIVDNKETSPFLPLVVRVLVEISLILMHDDDMRGRFVGC